MNQWNGTGNLTKDVELRQTTSGKSVASFSIACRNSFDKDKPDYVNCVVWGKQAESCAKYLSKGKKVGVTGRLQTRSYDGNDGKKRYVTEIITSDVEFLSPMGENKEQVPSEVMGSMNPAVSKPAQGTFTPVDDDDLPF